METAYGQGVFVTYSGILKRVAVKLSKISDDLRLFSNGPLAGIGEIRLPPVQAGSSIMPGKVNLVIPEAVNQVAFEAIGLMGLYSSDEGRSRAWAGTTREGLDRPPRSPCKGMNKCYPS
nr:lyase family protein [Roseovarius atlanticus]